MSKFEYYEKRLNDDGKVEVLGWKKMPRHSVLAGQLVKSFLGCFDSEAEAEAEYGAMNWYNQYTSPTVSLDHLPGEGDFVPGGEYPDDW
jgi:hypothetical protein